MKTAAGALGLPRGERLRHAGEFQAVFQQGRRLERRSFVALWRPTPGACKVGFTVSRQVRGAVARNRVRRRLREAYRHHRPALGADIMLVFVGRASVLRVPFSEILGEMREAIQALGRREVGGDRRRVRGEGPE